MATMRSTSQGLVLELAEIDVSDAGRVGGKAANLSSLSQAGFPVPDGVVVTTDGFDSFLDDARLDADSPSRAVMSSPIPHGLREVIADSLGALADRRLAVRSSAVAEDLADASFAGQYETMLNAIGLDEVLEALRRVWASAFATHLKAYREEHSLGLKSMAVLLQEMVDAEAAGVAFSANPVTGDRHQVVINAVKGLGERLVSGDVSPDEWLVTADAAECESSPENAIDAERAFEIADLARRVESHFGTPQDIEWAIEDGMVFLLQARPITSLPDQPIEPIPIDFEVPPGYWQHDASHSPRPGHPIDLFIFPLVRATSQRWAEDFGYLFDGIEFREFGMWPYMRLVPMGGRQPSRMPPQWLMWLAARTVPAMRKRIAKAAEAVRSDKAGEYVDRWYETWQPQLNSDIYRHLDTDLSALNNAELDDHISSTVDLLERGIEIHSLLAGTLAIIMYDLATTCQEVLGWDLARTMDLVSGTSFKSTEPARCLHELANKASQRPAVLEAIRQPNEQTIEQLTDIDEQFSAEFHEFLHHYGCRALGYNVAEPTLAENPGLFLQMIKGQLEAGYDPRADQSSSTTTREQSAAEARQSLAEQPGDLSRFERALTRAMRAYPVREDNEFFTLSAPLAITRYAILEVGRRLAERGVIGDTHDVRFLELSEARAALLDDGDDLGDLIQHRKGERIWAELNPGPPSYGEAPPGPPALDFLLADARIPMEAMLWSFDAMLALRTDTDANSDSTLRGLAASAGEHTGPVRVVMDDSQFGKLQPGDVLVCPITSPVWSVLFPSIGALVTDAGGVLSHPAIIAREYAVPAVVATGRATELLSDGEIVTVDGTAGTVRKVEP